MGVTVRYVIGRFPEPAFSELHRQVFAEVQQESPALAEVLAAEKAAGDGGGFAPTSFAPAPLVRFGAYAGDELVGWSCGWTERGGRYYMASSGVREDHRRQGVYSMLLEAVVAHARDAGIQVVHSQHSVLNNLIIVCKLRRGFHIAGLSVSAQMGSLVELALHLSAPRRELFRSRVVPYVEPRGD